MLGFHRDDAVGFDETAPRSGWGVDGIKRVNFNRRHGGAGSRHSHDAANVSFGRGLPIQGDRESVVFHEFTARVAELEPGDTDGGSKGTGGASAIEQLDV